MPTQQTIGTRLRVAVEQAIARGEPTSKIMQTHRVAYHEVSRIRARMQGTGKPVTFRHRKD